jgi:hypothetical protein
MILVEKRSIVKSEKGQRAKEFFLRAEGPAYLIAQSARAGL